MSMNTTSGLPSGVEKFYVRTLLERALPLLIHRRWAQHKPMKPNSGKDIEFTRYNGFAPATTPLQEGVTPEGKALSKSKIVATLKQYGDWTSFSDVIQLTDVDPVVTESMEIFGEQKGETLDILMRNVMLSGTNVHRAGKVATKGAIVSGLAAKDVESMVRTLKRAHARRVTRMVNPSTGVSTMPVRPCFIALTHTDASTDWYNLDGFIPVEKYASQSGVIEGEIGSYKDLRVVETTQARVDLAEGGAIGTTGLLSYDATKIDVYNTIILAAEAYGESPLDKGTMGIVVKQDKSNSNTSDPLSQRTTTGWKVMWTGEILNDDHLIRYEHGVKALV